MGITVKKQLKKPLNKTTATKELIITRKEHKCFFAPLFADLDLQYERGSYGVGSIKLNTKDEKGEPYVFVYFYECETPHKSQINEGWEEFVMKRNLNTDNEVMFNWVDDNSFPLLVQIVKSGNAGSTSHPTGSTSHPPFDEILDKKKTAVEEAPKGVDIDMKKKAVGSTSHPPLDEILDRKKKKAVEEASKRANLPGSSNFVYLSKNELFKLLLSQNEEILGEFSCIDSSKAAVKSLYMALQHVLDASKKTALVEEEKESLKKEVKELKKQIEVAEKRNNNLSKELINMKGVVAKLEENSKVEFENAAAWYGLDGKLQAMAAVLDGREGKLEFEKYKKTFEELYGYEWVDNNQKGDSTVPKDL